MWADSFSILRLVVDQNKLTHLCFGVLQLELLLKVTSFNGVGVQAGQERGDSSDFLVRFAKVFKI